MGALDNTEMLGTVLHDLYLGSLDDASLTRGLALFARQANLLNCSITKVNVVRNVIEYSFSTLNFGQDWQDQYSRYYYSHSPLLPALNANRNYGRLIHCYEIIERREFESSLFFNDYLKKFDIHSVLSGVLDRDATSITFMALHRSPLHPEFQWSEIATINRMIGHFRTLIRLKDVFHAGLPAAAGTLEHLPAGAIQLSRAEEQLYRLLADGMPAKEAARLLNKSPNTIAVQRRSLYRKLGVMKQCELMDLARFRTGTGERNR